MSEPFQLLPAPDMLAASVPQLSDFSKSAARVELPPADVLEDLAFELACNPHDPHTVLARFGLTVFDYEVIASLPVFEAARRCAIDQIRTDPNHAARRKARRHLADAIDRVALMTKGHMIEPKDQLNAAKFLQSVALAEGSQGGAAAKKGTGGVNIQINLGTAVGQQLSHALRISEE